jgi:hypothetical protein
LLQVALAETSSFLQPHVYFTPADPAMPISPTHVAAGYPLCKPFAAGAYQAVFFFFLFCFCSSVLRIAIFSHSWLFGFH